MTRRHPDRGCGHWVQQEAPIAVNRALDTFLDAI
jgi:pimeloyl-ACP methyl ester carboxylesterase